ncbi:intestinal-type alkaline phosphatase-like [Stylophora pistillata]|uniref:intestinal-type alkaline phosphatase-like n=1 Tax=Stylophora pistillata TaxID=50429 RepID=UPI000C053A29|nr:intestinal-type alkaline phosphatase-like [Stylophora pistillata]
MTMKATETDSDGDNDSDSDNNIDGDTDSDSDRDSDSNNDSDNDSDSDRGRIDHGHHANKAVKAINDGVAMEKAVMKAKEMINKETLITVTADHSHVFTIGAYPWRGNPIFTLVTETDGDLAVGSDNKTYTSLGYANGPGGLTGVRPDLRGVDTTNKDYRTQATVRKSSETHGVEDVGVYADGPGAYLFRGVFEQQYVFHVMDHALCLSSSKQKTCRKHVVRGGEPLVTTGKPTASSGGYSICASSFISLIILASWIALLF